MKPTYWRTCVLVGSLAWSLAGNAAPIGPADPSAGVPVVRYESVFETYQPATEASASPDKLWRGANDAVAAPSNGTHASPMGAAMQPRVPVASDTTPVATLGPATGKTTQMPMQKSNPTPDDHAMHKGLPMNKPDVGTTKSPPSDQQVRQPAQKMSHEHHGKGH